MHHHHRRRKKRPNYGTRTVEIQRGLHGLGFILSGQQPCILSCIVNNSPADLCGLRAGNFLISVNGLNVSKLPHEAVVQLIGSSFGKIRMQIAENYFSDSSDEENVINSQISRIKPRYLHHKLKMNRLRNSPQKSRENKSTVGTNDDETGEIGGLRPVIEDATAPVEIGVAHSIIHSPTASTSKDISNVSAMIRKENDSVDIPIVLHSNLLFEHGGPGDEVNSLEYRAIVGYLGTIEMPKQIATSSKLQTVRSCIRKLRQEKRTPTTVLMTILPSCLTLKNSSATLLATYPSSRLNYVSSSSESENRFFGLVTSAIYSNTEDEPINYDGGVLAREVIISNSCHVFVVDTKLCDHNAHEQRANEFQIACTKDPISSLCLEFPNNSEYVVNLIRSMYTMKVQPPNMRYFRHNNHDMAAGAGGGPPRNLQDPQANSPQPSNHSEVTTTSSNSDSGIGFHNDCTNISDRILVVDFPGLMMNRIGAGPLMCGAIPGPARPLGICNNIEPQQPSTSAASASLYQNETIAPPPSHIKSKSADYHRLTVRAMPDPKGTTINQIPDLLSNFNILKNSNGLPPSVSNLITTRSCDDVISSVERNDFITIRKKKQIQMSMDDITMLSANKNHVDNYRANEHVFIEPGKPIKKTKKLPCKIESGCNSKAKIKNGHNFTNLITNKLSPKVFGISHKKTHCTSNSYENLQSDNFNKVENAGSRASANKNYINDFEVWGSLQEINKTGEEEIIDGQLFSVGTHSEPEFMCLPQLLLRQSKANTEKPQTKIDLFLH